MDTNQRTANNYQINTFTKGMNSDTSYDMIGADQYLFGLNIRITNNTLLFGNLDSNNTEMVVAPVPVGANLTADTAITNCDKILATDSIENVGVLIITLADNEQGLLGHWRVFKIVKNNSSLTISSIYTSSETTTKDRFSVTMLKEVEGIIKVYIADGEHPVMQLFLENTKSTIGYSNIDDDRLLSANQFFPTKKITLSKISGNLKTQQVLYTYRLYRQYGLASKLAPLTNKIHVIGSNRNIEQGNAEDTITDVGLKLRINADLFSKTVNNQEVATIAATLFDRIQIFRISYIKYGQEPEIYLIYDNYIDNLKIFEDDVKTYRFLDTGVNPILHYSLEEFSALSSQSIVPEIIESSQGYLFLGNCEDKTVLKLEDVEDSSDPSNQLTITECAIEDLIVDDSRYDEIPKRTDTQTSPYIPDGQLNIDIDSYLTQLGIDPTSVTKCDYNDMFVSSLMRSLRSSGENYRYGIVYYDKYGNHTNVKRIGQSDHITAANSLFSGFSRTTFTNSDLSEWRVFSFYGVIDDDILDSGTTNSSRSTLYLFYSSKLQKFVYWDISDYNYYSAASDLFSGTLLNAINNSDWCIALHNLNFPGRYASDLNGLFRVEYGKLNDELIGERIVDLGGNHTYYIYVDKPATYAKPIGVKINVPKPTSGDIVGFQVVRCEKTLDHTKNILQVALSRPWMQGKYQQPSYRTPCYPGMYLSTLFFYTKYTAAQLNVNLWGTDTFANNSAYFDHAGTNVENFTLYQAFSPEINIRRQDQLSNLSSSNCTLNILDYWYENRNLARSTSSLTTVETEVSEDDLQKIITYVDTTKTEYSFSVDQDDSNWYATSDINFPLNSTNTLDLYVPHAYDITLMKAYYNGSWVDLVDLVSSGSPYTNSDGCEFVEYRNGDGFTIFERIGTIFSSHTSVGVGYTNALTIKLRYPKDAATNYGNGALSEEHNEYSQNLENSPKYGKIHKVRDYVYLSNNYEHVSDPKDKSSQHTILKLDHHTAIDYALQDYQDSVSIIDVADVKNPGWSDGFSNVQMGSGSDFKKTTLAIKQYKSYTTNVGSWKYNNWVSNGMYNLAPTENDASALPGNMSGGLAKSWVYDIRADFQTIGFKQFRDRGIYSIGMIGPGPLCLLLNTEMPDDDSALCKHIRPDSSERLGTLVANITHEAQPYDDNYQMYYGFGNFYEFDNTDRKTVYVFDGDIYPLFAEFTNMFKAYDFKDYNKTLISGQVVYYIPLESKINVMYDYGMNYRNTQSSNLLLEPGEIEGITSQKRPLHQYNMIYSDNDRSIETFYTETNLQQTTSFPQRIWYSQLKTNGENIDNWLITRPADYIDADSRYGELTNLLANDNNVYFWQTEAFGKLSVNERSLITDNGGETILLGQGGVLQRTDYLSTKYGMREQDFSAINTEDAIFWIDVLNNAILVYKQNQVVNYGEALNVQNYINSSIVYNRPTIHYDLQTNELSCLAFKEDSETGKLTQFIFNTKLNAAQSVYTRAFDDTMCFNNVVVGLNIESNEISFTLYNYLQKLETDLTLMSPTIIQFVVNQSASLTKVFDSLKVVSLDRQEDEAEEYKGNYLESKTYWDKNGSYGTLYINQKLYKFQTDIRSTENKPNAITDREGNIIYDIPRVGNNDWGDRIRGKWMAETITDSNPKNNYCISHIITKFRQSYS